MDAEAIRAEVFQILALAQVTFTVEYKGVATRALGDAHDMDEWRCSFSRGAAYETFEFFTGLGLRAEPTQSARLAARLGFPGFTQNDIDRRTQCGRRYLAKLESLRLPKAPHAADVLHSLILDSSAAEQSFGAWCADFGYDEDSRKAFATYEACQKNADKLRRVLPRETWQAVAKALEDY